MIHEQTRKPSLPDVRPDGRGRSSVISQLDLLLLWLCFHRNRNCAAHSVRASVSLGIPLTFRLKARLAFLFICLLFGSFGFPLRARCRLQHRLIFSSGKPLQHYKSSLLTETEFLTDTKPSKLPQFCFCHTHTGCNKWLFLSYCCLSVVTNKVWPLTPDLNQAFSLHMTCDILCKSWRWLWWSAALQPVYQHQPCLILPPLFWCWPWTPASWRPRLHAWIHRVAAIWLAAKLFLSTGNWCF